MGNNWTEERKKSRVRKIKRRYGHDAFSKWGKSGGNPVLIEQGKRNRAKKDK